MAAVRNAKRQATGDTVAAGKAHVAAEQEKPATWQYGSLGPAGLFKIKLGQVHWGNFADSTAGTCVSGALDHIFRAAHCSLRRPMVFV